ncbi:PRC-barrel domain-containing protein [Rhodosalinus sp.]|uniref:PRC-barrel domain-containing protein n=1 Tax=Rhodosalinus sp. TaxID=2047741 RepID=UPI00397C8CA5
MFRSLMLGAVAVPLLALPAIAQDEEDVIVEDQGGSELRGDWMLGARVTSPEGEAIGSIEDLILDQDDGTVNAAVVSVGGFLGFGGKEIAVEWEELEIDYAGKGNPPRCPSPKPALGRAPAPGPGPGEPEAA